MSLSNFSILAKNSYTKFNQFDEEVFMCAVPMMSIEWEGKVINVFERFIDFS